MAPENVERDKFQVRLAKLSGGTAMILAGGATPVEQKRRLHLIEDAINAARAAIAEGVVPGGGMALLRVSSELEGIISRTQGSVQQGARLLQRALTKPLFHIATNCGLDGRGDRGRGGAIEAGHGARRAHGRLCESGGGGHH